MWHPGKTLANGTRVPPSNWVSVFRGSAWEWNDVRKEYYLHQFLVKQPDLNYRNPALVQEMKDVMTFWLGKGVHGFRIDAVPYLFESLPVNGVYPDEEKSGETDDPDNPTYLVHQHTQNLDETFDMMYQWRKVVDDFKQQTQSEDIVLMAEAYTPLLNIIRLFGNEVSKEHTFRSTSRSLAIRSRIRRDNSFTTTSSVGWTWCQRIDFPIGCLAITTTNESRRAWVLHGQIFTR